MQAQVLHGVIVVTFAQAAGALLLHVEAMLLHVEAMLLHVEALHLHVEVQDVIFVTFILLYQAAMLNVPA